MPHAAGHAIAGPDRNDVEAVTPGVGHHLIQTWPAGTSAGDAIGVALHDLQATLLGHGFEIVQLRSGH
jgi:hypothetical protein